MKYIDADKLIAEIHKHIGKYDSMLHEWSIPVVKGKREEAFSILTMVETLHREQPEAFEISKFCQPVPENIANCVAEHYWEMLDDEEKEDARTIETTQQEQPEVDLEKEIKEQWKKWDDIITYRAFAFIARHFYERGFNARKEESK